MTPIEALNKYLGYDSFRPGQEEIVNSIISGENALVVLPTGAGKSLCYQIPALLSKSFAIVISPLIALMKDQVDSLNKTETIASFINSSLDFAAGEKVLNSVSSGKIKILFLSPEKLSNTSFVEKIKQLSPEYIFIDEAHCISEWGHNFRPSYRKIHEFIDHLGIKKVSAFTATATEEVREDIVKQLSLLNPRIFVRGFERDNLHINVIASIRKKEKAAELIRSNKLPAIVYTATRNGAEELAEYLRKESINAVFYHAGLQSEMKRIIQDDFMSDRVKVICATNAFGMGIDKNDIRLVIHYNMPGSIENYYQEIGRAGRDGKPSKVYLLYEERDAQIHEYFIKNATPSRDQIELVYDAICDYGGIAVGMLNERPIVHDANLSKLFEINQISSGIVQSSIKVLVESGYLTFKNELYGYHTVRFPLKPDQLRSFINSFANATHKDLLLLLVKTYGSKIFTESTRIDIKSISERLETSLEEIIEDLSALLQGGIIEYRKPPKNPSFMLSHPRVQSKALKLNLTMQKAIKKNMEHKLEVMEEFVSTDKCRMGYILHYFGQNSKDYNCGKCDNCLEGGSTPSLDYIDEIILRTLHESKTPLRKKTLLQILHGSSTLYSFNKLSTFGACVHFSKDQIEEAIEQLVIARKILTSNDVIKLSETGNDFFTNDRLTEAKSNLTDYESELKLFNALRQIRKDASEKFGQQPHLICTDEILRAVSKAKPTSHSALLSVAGFTQRMFNKIGDDIINAVKTVAKNDLSKREIQTSNLPRKSKLILELVEKKYSLEEISELAKISESLLSIQLEGLISMIPDLDISNLINKEELTAINSKIDEGISDMKELRNSLDGKISYSKIRIALSKRSFN